MDTKLILIRCKNEHERDCVHQFIRDATFSSKEIVQSYEHKFLKNRASLTELFLEKGSMIAELVFPYKGMNAEKFWSSMSNEMFYEKAMKAYRSLLDLDETEGFDADNFFIHPAGMHNTRVYLAKMTDMLPMMEWSKNFDTISFAGTVKKAAVKRAKPWTRVYWSQLFDAVCGQYIGRDA